MSNVNGSVIAGLLVAAFPVCQNVGDFCMKSGGHVPPDVPPFDTHNGRTKRRSSAGRHRGAETSTRGSLCGSVIEVERRSLTGKLSLSCARPVADG